MSARDVKKSQLMEKLEKIRLELRLVEAEKAAVRDEASDNKTDASINQLRRLNEQQRKQITEEANRDANVIKAAFHDKPTFLKLCSNKSVEDTFAIVKQKTLCMQKRINALKRSTNNEVRYAKKRGGTHSVCVQTQKVEADCNYLSKLKGCVQSIKAEYKEQERQIVSNQRDIIDLLEEALGYPAQREKMEAERQKDRKELEDLQSMVTTVENFNQTSMAQLKQLEIDNTEKLMTAERTKASMRKQLKELHAQAEEVSKKAQRQAKWREELRSQALRNSTMLADKEERARSTLNQAFQRIKEATGITSSQDLKKAYQKDSLQHLMNEKEENEQVLQQRKEEREILNQHYQDMKEKRAAKLCGEKQMLDVYKQRLRAQQHRYEASKEHVSQLDKTIVFIRVWSEKLADRLKHIELPEDKRVKVSPESEEYFLELLGECDLKLEVLREKLKGKDLPAIKKDMEEVGFSVKAEGQQQACNTFVKPNDDLSEEEDGGEKYEPDILSREELKRQSQQIIDSRSKRGKKKQGRF